MGCVMAHEQHLQNPTLLMSRRVSHKFMTKQRVEVLCEDKAWREAEVHRVDPNGDLCLTYVGVPYNHVLSTEQSWLTPSLGWIPFWQVEERVKMAVHSSGGRPILQPTRHAEDYKL